MRSMELREALAQLRLAHTGRPKEQERPDRPPWILQTGPGTPHRVGHHGDRLVLADHTPSQLVVHMQQLFALALQHPVHRNAGPA
jgi:hypothetical protein